MTDTILCCYPCHKDRSILVVMLVDDHKSWCPQCGWTYGDPAWQEWLDRLEAQAKVMRDQETSDAEA